MLCLKTDLTTNLQKLWALKLLGLGLKLLQRHKSLDKEIWVGQIATITKSSQLKENTGRKLPVYHIKEARMLKVGKDL